MAPSLETTTDLFRLLADPTRVRLLHLVEREELTVAEITRITRLAQSRVSTHLMRLREAALVVDRKQGVSTFYRLNDGAIPEPAAGLLAFVRGQIAKANDPLLAKDKKALEEALARRSGKGGTWADSVAGQMDRHYSPGRTWEATAWGALGLARLGAVLDVASGDGVTAELLSFRSRHVTCLDRSARVSVAGKARLRHLKNVRYVRGDMHSLPFHNGAFDQALLLHALTYSEDPKQAFRELFRVLKPGGALVAATLERHAHKDALQRFNHVRLGFDPSELEELLRNAGFVVELCKVTSRERQKPHHGVITVHAHKRNGMDASTNGHSRPSRNGPLPR